MQLDNAPIQEPVQDPSGRFAQVWARWLVRIGDMVRGLYTTTRTTSDSTLNPSNFHQFVNTDSGNVEVTLPAGEQGLQFRIVNTGTSGYTLTVTPNGSENLIGSNTSFDLSDGESLIIFYDTTDGWY